MHSLIFPPRSPLSASHYSILNRRAAGPLREDLDAGGLRTRGCGWKVAPSLTLPRLAGEGIRLVGRGIRMARGSGCEQSSGLGSISALSASLRAYSPSARPCELVSLRELSRRGSKLSCVFRISSSCFASLACFARYFLPLQNSRRAGRRMSRLTFVTSFVPVSARLT